MSTHIATSVFKKIFLSWILICSVITSLNAEDMEAPSSQTPIDKSQVAALVQKQHGGKVLSVDEFISADGSVEYRVKLLQTAGRIKIVTLDAKTGHTVE